MINLLKINNLNYIYEKETDTLNINAVQNINIDLSNPKILLPKNIIINNEDNDNIIVSIKFNDQYANKSNWVIKNCSIQLFNLNDNFDLNKFKIIKDIVFHISLRIIQKNNGNLNMNNIKYPDLIGSNNSQFNIDYLNIHFANLPDHSILNLNEYFVNNCFSKTQEISANSNITNLIIKYSNITNINKLTNKYLNYFYYHGDKNNQLDNIEPNFEFNKVELINSGIHHWNNNTNYININKESNISNIKLIKHKKTRFCYGDDDDFYPLEHECNMYLINNNIHIGVDTYGTLYKPYSGIFLLENTHFLNFFYNNYNYYNLLNNQKCSYKNMLDLHYSDKKKLDKFENWFINTLEELLSKNNIKFSIHNNLEELRPIDYSPNDIDMVSIFNTYLEKFNEADLVRAIINIDYNKINQLIKEENKNISKISENLNLYQFVKDIDMINFLHDLKAKIHIDDFDKNKHSNYYLKLKPILEKIYLNEQSIKDLKNINKNKQDNKYIFPKTF